MKINLKIFSILFLLLCMISFYCSTGKGNSSIITFKKNGAWCWFQDERAILCNNVLLFGTVAGSHGYNGKTINGNIEITAYDLDSNTPIGTKILYNNLKADDHNAPGLLRLSDKRVLAVYSKHGKDDMIRYRVTQNPSNYLNWGPELVIKRNAGVTYSNVHFLKNENNKKGRLYNFYRGENWNPNFVYSDDDGKTWIYGGGLVKFNGRPYVKYTSNGKDKIHFITTEHHPHNFNNSIYHAFIENGRLYKSDGSLIKDLSDGPMLPSDGTKIFSGDSLNNAWTIDIHLDKNNFPYIAYSVQKNRDPSHIIYRYAKWNGKKWEDNFLGFAGTCLYDTQPHYSGLVALNPDDPGKVYISTDKDPKSGTELISKNDNKRHYEIFQGTTLDKGKNWTWKQITENSTLDNIRPIMPKSDSKYKVLLWLRGNYMDYTKYDLDVVGIVNP